MAALMLVMAVVVAMVMVVVMVVVMTNTYPSLSSSKYLTNTRYFILTLLFFSNKCKEQVLERLHDLIR